ncbi:hypothetical protein JOF53_001106 [Crossiella equi]|uniref:Cobalamin-independent methionine synthase MetE C-terminal/archaeal domain-containing protein n=1 Tax=Crossiella equi TaxID=130796 RepID=A0ABS5A6L0_9PSEU|nr:hypothetical protein [Crossiella equi]MBP2472234.1 hypothetical protein [Crossiella equi]
MAPQFEADILSIANDDYTSLVDFEYVTSRVLGPGPEALEAAGELAVRLVTEGKVVAGNIADRFHPWALSTEEAVERIIAHIDHALQSGADIVFGEPCWFDVPAHSADWGEPAAPIEIPDARTPS